jgi:two-component system NtrC family sensor kinase
MAAVVAHEVNNPLTGISTYARLLRKKLSQSPAQETASAESTDRETARVLKLIESEAIRCGEIVRDLLLFSKTPAARFSQEQLQPLVKRCLLLLDHQARAQDIQILQDIPADLPAISCDASQLQQLLLALTINALEATPAGGSVSISATTAEKDEQIILRVADTGSGIAPEHLDKIFEPFFTTKQDTEGVGLGLAVVYGIVKRHQGSVVVDSSPAAGTTFTVRLPIRRSADSPEPEGSFEEAPGR